MRARLLAESMLLAVSVAACATSRPAPPPAAAQAKFRMRMYWLVVLRRGPSWSAGETEESKRLFAGHMANIRAMARAGKLLVAGPFDADAGDAHAPAGLFLFDVETVDEVKVLLTGDPAIQAGRLVPEILHWAGPAGLTYDGRAEALAAEGP